MTENKVVIKKAGVNKQLKLSSGWLLEKKTFGYTLSDKTLHTFIHGDKLRFPTNNKINAWLNIYQNDVYIATVWIDNAIEIENIKEFIKGV